MQPKSPTSILKQRLACGTCAIALVGSLVLYQKTVTVSPVAIAQTHWAAIASDDPDRASSQYSPDAILMWTTGFDRKVYQGEEIYCAWKQFFNEHQIQNVQVLQQQQSVEQSLGGKHRTIKAEIALTAKLDRRSVKVFSVFYQARFDERGKIIHEVWQAHPELTV